jgi:hypothetical protein
LIAALRSRGHGLASRPTYAFAPTADVATRAWYDTRSLGLADGAAVGSVPNASGTGAALTQATASLKPLYRASLVNGLPAIDHDGVDDRLAAALGALAAPFTILVVARFGNLNQPASDFDYLLQLGNGGASQNASISRQASGTNADKYYSFDGTAQRFGPVLAGQQWQILTARHGTVAQRHTLRINGTNQTNPDDDGASLSTDGSLTVGFYAPSTVHPFFGQWTQLVVWPALLTDAQCLAVERGAGQLYGISVP